MIYLDNAATTLIKPERVAQLVMEGITSHKFGNPGRGSHRTALNALEEIYKTREAIAKLFHVRKSENIALTQNASFALNMVLHSLFDGKNFHVITSVSEHNSVLRPLYALEKKGLHVSHIGIDQNACLNYSELEEYLRPETKAIVITHASNVTGNKTDLARVYRFAKTHNLILIVDASQTAGSSTLNISQFDNTIVCATGHKSLFGPGGTGIICVNGNFDFQQVFAGGSGFNSFAHEHPHTMPDIFEVGTLNVPSFMGLRGGIEFILETGIDKIESKVNALKAQFLRGLQSIPKIKIVGDKKETDTSGIVSLNVADIPSSEISLQLDEQYGIATRPGAHCAPRLHEALGTEKQGLVRFSFSYFNTMLEVAQTLEALEALAKKA